MEKRPTFALVNREYIRHNFGKVKESIPPDTEVLAVIKANAYGHGAFEVANVLRSCGCRMFGVAFCEEGAELRSAGIREDIVVLGGVYSNQLKGLIDHDLTPVVYDLDTAVSLNALAKKMDRHVGVHVKVDTGMGRLGLLRHEVVPFFEKLKHLGNISVEGIMSHFSDVDEEDKAYADKQLKDFMDTIDIINGRGWKPRFVHMSNSATVIDYPQAHFNMVRPGIMLYGALPNPRFYGRVDIRPALELKTRVVRIKRLCEGSVVSYGRSFVAGKETLIATVPLGYGDGYPRSLSGKGEMLIRGKRARVAGYVCMDLTMLDVSSIEGIAVGDEVVVIGRQGEEELTAGDVAAWAGMIPYELFCNISQRVERLYI